jgi:hypothetical protein
MDTTSESLGSILFQLLLQIARNDRTEHFQGYILPENKKMLNFIK